MTVLCCFLGNFSFVGLRWESARRGEACVVQLTVKEEPGREPCMRNLREMAGSEQEREHSLGGWEIVKEIEMLQNFGEIVYVQLSFAASLFAFGVVELRNSGIGSCMNFQAWLRWGNWIPNCLGLAVKSFARMINSVCPLIERKCGTTTLSLC